ncbi:MAG TPA: hypothetical protein VHL77_11630, partial [Ferruginibacter sp.]|nr:hypothetical protein [Ferruginibacter sp.]
VAMGMRKQDDLMDICKAVYAELQALGFTELRNTLIDTFVDDEKYFIDYDYSEFSGGSSSKIPYSGNKVVEKYIEDIRKSGEAFSEITVKGAELESWKKFRRDNGEVEDPTLNDLDALYYYKYSIGPGSIGISTYSRISGEKLNILHRFRNVFNLAHQRYADITKAEAQAKESRIETALERVRAVAMAMNRSEQLLSVAEVMFKELASLGFSNIRNAQISIENEEKQSFVSYVHSDHEHAITEASYTSSALLLDAKKELSTTGAFYQAEYSGKDLEDWRTWRMSRSALLDERELSAVSLRWYLWAIGKGHIGISTFDAITPEQIDILNRFKNVFELSYRRFDDLQNAEAQAREAKIEAALERTRTQSMIMQHSNDLNACLQVFHEQVLSLGINSAFSFLWLPDEKKEEHIFWAVWEEDGRAGQTGIHAPAVFKNKAITYPLDRNDPATRQCLADWKSDESIHSYAVPPDAVESYFASWAALFEGAEKLNHEYFRHGLYYVEAFMKYGCFGVMVETELTAENKKLLGRFAVEFERTYTRFLDLQKAEAQAREAQIELGLERVRARAMAMQKSDELKELISTVFTELTKLDLVLTRCVIMIFDTATNSSTWWMANAEAPADPIGLHVKEHQLPPYSAYLKAWK